MNAPGRSTPATKALVKTPRPHGQLFTIEAVATMFHRRPRTIYDLLSTHAARFGPPMYQQLDFPRSRRLYRVLSSGDIRVFSKMFPVYVKRQSVDG